MKIAPRPPQTPARPVTSAGKYLALHRQLKGARTLSPSKALPRRRTLP